MINKNGSSEVFKKKERRTSAKLSLGKRIRSLRNELVIFIGNDFVCIDQDFLLLLELVKVGLSLLLG